MQISGTWLTETGVQANRSLAHYRSVVLAGLLLLMSLCTVQGQNVCVNPAFPGSFTVDKARVCVGSPVAITNVPTTIQSDAYNFQYDGKSSVDKIVLTATKTFSYTQPGSFTIVQVASGNGSATGTILCREVTVLPVDPVKFTAQACSGRRAIVLADAPTLGQYDLFEIYWGDGVRQQKTRAEIVLEQSHTYTNAGNYSITVQGIYNAPANCRSTLGQGIPVTVTATATAPIITALKSNGATSIDIKYQAGTGSAVQLYQKINGTYTATGQNGSGSGTFTVQTDTKQEQCFQVVTQDACNTAGLKSDEVCSLVLDAKAANKQNNLSWQPYAGTAGQFRFYRVNRNGGLNGQVSNRTTTTYSDANKIECGVQYCYTLEATAGPAIITSSEVCVSGINSNAPDSITNVIVSVEDNKPRLVAALPATSTSASYTLLISRADSPAGPFLPVGSAVNKNTFIDEEANTSASVYCYQVSVQSNCGLTSSPSKPVCTVLLTSKNATGIDWNVDSPFTPETVDNYIVEVIDSLNGTRAEIPVSGNTHFEPDPNDPNLQSQKYRIIAISANGSISYSNFYTFRREARILVPDAFTPNGDNMNNTFLAKGVYFDQFKMIIYDRWGEIVYNTTDRNQGWDGKISGQNAQPGQYMYRIEVIDLTGLKTVKTGAMLLIR